MSWQRKKRGSTENILHEKNEELAGLQFKNGPPNMQQIKKLQQEVQIILEQEDIKWCQKSKEDWLKNRDRNTKYFHASANQKKKKSTIEKIVDSRGRLCSTRGSGGYFY